jgi:Gpi18-like mannosyltransferase
MQHSHEIKKVIKICIILGLIYLSVRLRMGMFHYDNLDLGFFIFPWYDTIVKNGGLQAIKEPFYNYSPPYLYFITLATLVRSFIPQMEAIKWISVFFDFISAIFMYLLVRIKFSRNNLPWVGFFCVLFAPVVFINSSYWGQCDGIYSAFLLASLYFVCKRQYTPAIIMISSAFAFKIQAVFLAPLFLLLFINREFSWKSLFLAPITYIAWMIPALIVGCPVRQIFNTYVNQANMYGSFTMSAPNLYVYVPNNYFDQAARYCIYLTIILVLFLVVHAYLNKGNLNPEEMILLAVIFTTFIPFFLPKMHERYFYPAALLSIALLFYLPNLRVVPPILQISSLISYAPFLLGREEVPLTFATSLNLFVVIILFVSYFRTFKPQEVQTQEQIPAESGIESPEQ